MTNLGVITIGQSPRSDMVPEMTGWLPNVGIRERGALDGLDRAEIEALAPVDGDETLTTRLSDGSSVVVGRVGLLPLVQRQIDVVEDEGVDVVLIVCTGAFPAFRHRRPLLLATRLLSAGVAALVGDLRLGVICPLPDQVEQAREKFDHLAREVNVAAADPYCGDVGVIEDTARTLAGTGSQVLVLDCMGYTQTQREAAARASGKSVLLARSVVARLTAEFCSGSESW